MRLASFCIAAVAAAGLALTGCKPITPTAPPSAPGPPPVELGTKTNLAGVVNTEQPVYAQPVSPNVTPPQRIWTLLAGTEITAICRSSDPKVNFGDNLYVSWAPDKSGYVYWDSVSITTRTSDTNEAINVSALKGC